MNKYTLYSVIILLFITFSNISYSANNKENLIQDWRLIQAKDKNTGEISLIRGQVYYQFQKDGTVILTDLIIRERSIWDWKLKGNLLTIRSDTQGYVYTGRVHFYDYKKDEWSYDKPISRFSYVFTSYKIEVSGNKKYLRKVGDYIWIFEK